MLLLFSTCRPLRSLFSDSWLNSPCTNHQLELDAISLSIVGPHADADSKSPESRNAEKFKIVEGEDLKHWLDRCVASLPPDLICFLN